MPALSKATRDLLAYTAWADRVHVSAAAQVEPQDLERETGASFGSLLGTLAHILASERLWLSRFLGNPIEPPPEASDYADFPGLQAAFEEHLAELEFFLASLTEEQLLSEISWVSRAGEPRAQPLWQPLLHMVNHSTYHRGQVSTLLRQLGYQPPSSDMVQFFAARTRG